MRRIDRVKLYVLDTCAKAAAEGRPVGVRASDVADALGIWRNDATVDLNTLVAEGVLIRQGKKNILYFPAEQAPAPPEPKKEAPQPAPKPEKKAEPDAFSGLIGSTGSLRLQIQSAKAAVSYPPYGLHMLIVGQPGVGKSMFSEAVWKYACQNHTFQNSGENIPFIRFNCAEYADNPQLLLSHLFGHKKGAFTGAGEDKAGLVEAANGGILFLDEIHCLTHTGQELFFTLLDTGCFRRMGETSMRQSHFMLIGATSESINGKLLQTFRRRIPVLIQIPSLHERPPREKLDLIQTFFATEARRVNRPIRVSGEVMNLLMDYEGQSNIGDLRNTIQLACAKSHFRSVSAQQSEGELQITTSDLYIHRQNTASSDQSREELFDVRQTVLIKPDDVVADRGLPESGQDIYEFVSRQCEVLASDEGYSSPISPLVGEQLRGLRAELLKYGETSVPRGRIPNSILQLADQLLSRAHAALNREYPENCKILLAMHLQQYLDRIRSGILVYNPHMQLLEVECGDELDFLNSQRDWLSQELATEITDDELGYIAIFLQQNRENVHMPDVSLLLVSCGRNTARSMAEYANRVIGTHYAHWVNNRNMYNWDRLFDELCDTISAYCSSAGVLILTDIEAFQAAEATIEKRTGIPCRVFPVLDQWIVLDTCRGMMTQNYALEELYPILSQSYAQHMRSRYVDLLRGAANLPGIPDSIRKKYILAVCTTGIGSARRIQELLQEWLQGREDVEIITMSVLERISDTVEALGPALKAIVGTINPNIPGYPFISADRVLLGTCWQELDRILCGSSLPEPEPDPEAEDILPLLEAQAGQFAPSFAPEFMIAGIRKLLSLLTTDYGLEDTPDLAVRVFMHTSAMLERIAHGQQLDMSVENLTLLQSHMSEYETISGYLQDAFPPDRLTIPDGERFFFLMSLPEPSSPESR